jgi:hypothetical protein
MTDEGDYFVMYMLPEALQLAMTGNKYNYQDNT